ncbi:MAG: FapA family protein [Chitinispirillia bacterium]|nr:FapA family protein [Chitinispirillia bacterium]
METSENKVDEVENAGSAQPVENEVMGGTDFFMMEVRLAADKMSATISIDRIEGLKGEICAEILTAKLNKAGVVHGIDKDLLAKVSDSWNRNPRYVETPPIAKGTYPEPGKEGLLKMAVKHLSIGKEINKVLGKKYFGEITMLAPKLQRVDQGTVIARREGTIPDVPGQNVLGEFFGKKQDEEVTASGIKEKNNVYISKNVYTAAKTGIVYIEREEPAVLPLEFDGFIDIQTAPDMMDAQLVIIPAGEGGKMPSEEGVRALIDSYNIIYGLDEKAISGAIARFTDGSITAQEVVEIARGLPAITGDDGYVEFTFNTESSMTPNLNEDGSVDYKNLNLITSVSEGDTLAILHPPAKGTPGRDILGRVRPAFDGKKSFLPVGTNTQISRTDHSLLVALVDGIVRYNGSNISIAEGHYINGDVDYSTGNVKYERSVCVKGDVRSGFDVDCGGDLQIHGIIEDCNLKIGGSLLSRGGFVGNGEGLIIAKGDVNLGFIKNQNVICEGSVNIAKESMNSNITAKKIQIHGNTLSVAGGILAATDSIIVRTAGNISGIRSVLQIIPPLPLTEEYNKTETANKELQEKLKKVNQQMNTLPPKARLDKELMRKFRDAIAVVQQQITALEERLRKLHIEMNNYDEAFMRIDRCAFPGTIFKFGQRNMVLTEMLNGVKSLRLINGEIRVI